MVRTLRRLIDLHDHASLRLGPEEPNARMAILDRIRLGQVGLLEQFPRGPLRVDLLLQGCHGRIVRQSAATEQDPVVPISRQIDVKSPALAGRSAGYGT